MFRRLLNYLLGPPQDNGHNGSKFNSRRYRTMWALTVLIFIVFAFPPIASYVLAVAGVATLQLVILTDGVFATLLTLIWGTYLASDFATKRIGQYKKDPIVDLPCKSEPDPPYEDDKEE